MVYENKICSFLFLFCSTIYDVKICTILIICSLLIIIIIIIIIILSSSYLDIDKTWPKALGAYCTPPPPPPYCY